MRKSILLITIFTVYFVFGQYKIHSQNNQNSSNTQQTQPNQNVTVTEPVKVLLEPAREEIEAEKGYKTRQEQRDESNAMWNKTGIVINSFLFVLVLIQAFLSLRALNKMERQANTMEVQYTAMREQNDIMVEQSKTMNSQLDLMEKQTQMMRESLEANQKSINQNERAIKISRQQAKISETALEHTKEAFIVSERAYIGVKDLKIEPLSKGAYPSFTMIYINGGRTPASNFKSVYDAFLSPDNFSELNIDKIDLNSFKEPDSYEGVFIPAGKENEVTFEATKLIITPPIINALTSGQLRLFIFGKVFYKDFQGNKQTYEFWAEYLPTIGRFRYCK